MAPALGDVPERALPVRGTRTGIHPAQRAARASSSSCGRIRVCSGASTKTQSAPARHGRRSAKPIRSSGAAVLNASNTWAESRNRAAPSGSRGDDLAGRRDPVLLLVDRRDQAAEVRVSSAP